MSDREILVHVFELLKFHYPYVLNFLLAKVPSAKELLAAPSAAETRLRELQRKDSEED